ncbi:Phosphoethanolamine N-methyltransferase [Achaetomium macrosporum]|uniref:Phosphoethanolamine N-methyltransferase n=1 Tax=Achaetomium macrosporum TaxID=79813 RepID=A0AAN7CAH5_9PEZI|nr:Phosphoethanolamine N-methyltransferase [Achaetomium macrosporum]
MHSEKRTADPDTDWNPRPSSSSTHITVGMHSTPEEDLYAEAEAMQATMREAPASASEQQATPFSFDSDMSKYPASMTSSVRDHVYEGGLRYHAYRAGKYAFPNDEVEQNRDDMKHTMTLMLCQGAYFYAPVEDVLDEGAEVLDLGTGTGIWAMELGDRYPNTTITGIDLSPIQPNFVPENVHFFVDDFEEEWVDPENKYDYIHLRHTLHSVRDPQLLLERVLRHLKPGGYFECAELHYSPQCDDDTLNPSTPYALRDWMNYVVAGMRVLGSDSHAILSLPEQMKAAGFTDVQRTTHKCPIGVWARDKRLRFCGLFLRTALMDGLRGTSRRPLLALGWTQLQIEMFLVEVRKALMDGGVHSYLTLHVVHGRKPLS